ncbi:MAG: tetratricopeptide repeat protein [Anaerolineae bacterium]
MKLFSRQGLGDIPARLAADQITDVPLVVVCTPGTFDWWHEPGDPLRTAVEAAGPVSLLAATTRYNSATCPDSLLAVPMVRLAISDETYLLLEDGLIALRTGDTATAMGALTAAVTREALATGYALRGEAYLQRGDPYRAQADFNKALRIDPGLLRARLNRAAVRAQTGNPAGARADYDAALAAAPGFGPALRGKAAL